MSEFETIEVRPLASALGAEILGVDLANGMSEAQFAASRQAFGRHGAIFFRGQRLTPEQHLAFAERWGQVNVNRFFKPVEGWPMIAEVRKDPEQKMNIGGSWHTDHSYDEVPALGSALYAREVPEVGGDTMFASMYAACETLSVADLPLLSLANRDLRQTLRFENAEIERERGLVDVQTDRSSLSIKIEPDVGPDLARVDARSVLKFDVQRVRLWIVEQPHRT